MIRDFQRLADGIFDLAVIGGGITGAGVALDATRRGLKTVLIEKNDFGSGTSGISSKLIHGGLRYLERGQFSLVYESLRERGRLLRNAPHLVRPLPFFLPLFPGSRVPPWKWRAGLKLYDLLAGPWNIQSSKALSPWDVGKLKIPWKMLPAGCLSFFDAQMDDSRLCLEVLISASQQGARLVNHAEVASLDIFPGRVSRLRVRDLLSGKEGELQARAVLNATGPWCDSIRKLAGESGPNLLSQTKGIHLVYPDWNLPGALLLLHPRDGRVFFIIPWMGKTLVGTTDTDCKSDPSKVEATPDDVAYLQEGVDAFFQLPSGLDAPVCSFAGLRPLVNSAASPAARSREFLLHEGSSGLLSAVGGKFTTFRSMAEEITNTISRKLGNTQPCTTQNLLLAGGHGVRKEVFFRQGLLELKWRYGVNNEPGAHLLSRYGTRARRVAAVLAQEPRFLEPVIPGFPDLAGEFLFQQKEEMAHTGGDFLFQRTRLGLLATKGELAWARKVLREITGVE
ncbi:MAG: glycerol-3-phosphate dehydrogenase/oxidase [Gemmataceae bacterium]|nr:glycerol-3-phosphate dehydrogenase/oxidase [Gemmataceae bacterium]